MTLAVQFIHRCHDIVVVLLGSDLQFYHLPIQPLTECLGTFNPSMSYRDVTLAPIPPEFKSMAGKPVFFDLALDHIEFPSLAHRAEKKGGGLTGFVKGLFWGKN